MRSTERSSTVVDNAHNGDLRLQISTAPDGSLAVEAVVDIDVPAEQRDAAYKLEFTIDPASGNASSGDVVVCKGLGKGGAKGIGKR